jgi:hypothetical protein
MALVATNSCLCLVLTRMSPCDSVPTTSTATCYCHCRRRQRRRAAGRRASTCAGSRCRRRRTGASGCVSTPARTRPWTSQGPKYVCYHAMPRSPTSLFLSLYAVLFSLSTLPCPGPVPACIYHAMKSQGRGASGMDAYYNAEYGRRSLWVALVRACLQCTVLSPAEPPSLCVPNASTE